MLKHGARRSLTGQYPHSIRTNLSCLVVVFYSNQVSTDSFVLVRPTGSISITSTSNTISASGGISLPHPICQYNNKPIYGHTHALKIFTENEDTTNASAIENLYHRVRMRALPGFVKLIFLPSSFLLYHGPNLWWPNPSNTSQDIVHKSVEAQICTYA